MQAKCANFVLCSWEVSSESSLESSSVNFGAFWAKFRLTKARQYGDFSGHQRNFEIMSVISVASSRNFTGPWTATPAFVQFPSRSIPLNNLVKIVKQMNWVLLFSTLWLWRYYWLIILREGKRNLKNPGNCKISSLQLYMNVNLANSWKQSVQILCVCTKNLPLGAF